MGRVIEASNSMDLLAFEVPEFHDRQQRALVSASRPTQMTAGLAGLSGGLLSAAGISVVLLAVQPLFLGLILIAFVPAWLATVAAGRAMYLYAAEQTEADRRRFYLQMVLTNKDAAKEPVIMRVAGLAAWMSRIPVQQKAPDTNRRQLEAGTRASCDVSSSKTGGTQPSGSMC